jgi:hypothetical protein
LKAAPFNLLTGSSICATVIATNALGSSSASNPGNGAVIKAETLIIPDLTLNATIGQDAILNLPNIGAEYIVLSSTKFNTTIERNQLKVKSISNSDVGTYLL